MTPPAKSSYTDGFERLTAKYHHEDGTWWSEIVGWTFSATAPTLEELREATRSLIPFGIDERLPEPTSLFFIHYQPSPCVTFDCAAQEVFAWE